MNRDSDVMTLAMTLANAKSLVEVVLCVDEDLIVLIEARETANPS